MCWLNNILVGHNITVVENTERVRVVQRACSLFSARHFPYETRRVDDRSVQYGARHITCATIDNDNCNNNNNKNNNNNNN
jgi:hypothetical protein